MSDKMLTENQVAEILAPAQALTNMPAEERRAASLLKELLGGEYKPRDTGGAQGMHDFDLRLDDGRTLAVEVTTDTSRVDKAFQDQIKSDQSARSAALKLGCDGQRTPLRLPPRTPRTSNGGPTSRPARTPVWPSGGCISSRQLHGPPLSYRCGGARGP